MPDRTSERPLRVTVLGLGAMGRQHARVLTTLPGAELVAVCDVSEEARSWAESRLGVPQASRLEDLLAFKPDAVVNATPTGLHAETTKPLLEAGVSTLVEKPIARGLPEAQELAETARENGALLVGHVERFNPARVPW